MFFFNFFYNMFFKFGQVWSSLIKFDQVWSSLIKFDPFLADQVWNNISIHNKGQQTQKKGDKQAKKSQLLGKATQNLKAKQITRRQAFAKLALKIVPNDNHWVELRQFHVH